MQHKQIFEELPFVANDKVLLALSAAIQFQKTNQIDYALFKAAQKNHLNKMEEVEALSTYLAEYNHRKSCRELINRTYKNTVQHLRRNPHKKTKLEKAINKTKYVLKVWLYE